MHGLDWLLIAVLVLDALQLVAAFAALGQGRRRTSREEHVLAAYSFRHAGLLAIGAVLLAIPPALGLVGAVADENAIVVVVLVELAVLVVARPVLVRLHRAATA